VDGVRIDLACPNCRSAEVPKLIVRGTGRGSPGTSLQCRRCGTEWSDEATRASHAS